MYDYSRKSHNRRTAAVRELCNVLLCLATVLQTLHDHLAAALHVTLDNRTTTLRSVLNCLRSASRSPCSFPSEKIAGTNGRSINVRQALVSVKPNQRLSYVHYENMPMQYAKIFKGCKIVFR